MDNLTTNSPEMGIDIAATHRVAKARWLRDSAPKRSFADILPLLRFSLLVLAFFAMFALSASHTVDAFHYNVDSWAANAAPLAFEVFLIGVTLATSNQEKRGWMANITIFVIVVVTIYANAISGLTVATLKTGSDTFNGYHLFALIAAPIVPLATVVVGHMLSHTLLTWQRIDRAAAAWRDAELEELYRALQSEGMKRGLTPGRAGRWAFETAKAYIGTNTISTISNMQQPLTISAMPSAAPALELPSAAPAPFVASVPSVMSTNGTDVRTDNGHNGSTNTNKPSVKRNPNALDDLRTWAKQVDVTGLSVDQFWGMAKSAGVNAGRTSAAQVLAELQEVKA